MKKFETVFAAMAIVSSLSACEEPHQNTDQIQRKQQEMLSRMGAETVGMPAITSFSEKKLMKDILERRDRAEPTITYTEDMSGKLHKRCDSLGYGISVATQFTNPQRIATDINLSSHTTVVLPQADPNGLFSPPQDSGRWILCVNPQTKQTAPILITANTVISPFPLD